jgi:outer membrane protein assembly factor BamB
VLHGDRLFVQCDVQKGAFLAALSLEAGVTLWKKERDEVPTWGTPTVFAHAGRTQVVVNGYKHIGAYDAETGKEIWRMRGGGDIPVPTPVLGHGLLFITSAHGRMSPIYAVRPSAKGDITLPEGATSSEHIAWSIRRGGNYMQTPIVAGDYLFWCRDSGFFSCFKARTGEMLYRQRIGSRSEGFTASPVAGDGKIYHASEKGNVYVMHPGPAFKILAKNPMGEPVMATPAISRGVLYVRTRSHLYAVGKKGE